VSARSPAKPQLGDDTFVPEELIGRLHRATENTILDLLESFTSQERANLAMFCYRKAHLRRIGLAIAATCDLPCLVQQWGSVLGQAIFAQSRDDDPDPDPVRVMHRGNVTLARSAGGTWPPLVDIRRRAWISLISQGADRHARNGAPRQLTRSS
jgi:hypothetical protein